jgi:hypothetical protein
MAATFPANGVQNSTNPGLDPAVVPVTVATAVSVASTAGGTSIVTIPTDGAPVLLVNTGSNTVFLGHSGVTTSTGYSLAASAAVLVTYGPPSPNYGGTSLALFGITASSTSNVVAYSPTNWPGLVNPVDV